MMPSTTAVSGAASSGPSPSGAESCSGRARRARERARRRPPAGRGEPGEEDEAQQRAATLLVDPHVLDQLGERAVLVAGGQADRGEDVAVAAGGGVVEAPGPAGELGGEDEPDGDRLAVAPPVVL